MPLPRALRLLGYALCVIIAAPEIVGWITGGRSPHGALWLICYAVFVAGFHLGASAASGAAGNVRRVVALGIEEGAMVALALAAPCQFAALALVVTALQAALFLRPRALVITLAAHTGVVSFLVMRGCGAWTSVSWLLAMVGFQAAVAVAVVLARRESEARADLLQTNIALRAARARLAEGARAEERHRIARDLHDALGHNLTALGLQLEVARSVAPEKAAPHVTKACALADEALSDVRAAVGAMRGAGGADVGRALRELCAETPGLVVHLDLPEPFAVDDADRAHCLVRCVQEIVTNTLRHAGAQNLWIRVARTASFVEVDARDDGRGASEVRAGNGLRGMRERIEEMGGRLAVAAAPAFSVSARLPVDEGAS
jgi:signal transduction histidine kinase